MRVRIFKRKQEQKAGRGSQLVQAGRDVVIHTLSVDDVQSIAREVMKSELAKLSEKAYDTASDRVSAFVRKLVMDLESRQNQGLQAFASPDMQWVLHNAQLAYARSGDEELADILVSLVSERAAAGRESLAGIAIGEAVSLVPKLVPQHFGILSVVFVLRYTSYNHMVSTDALVEYVNRFLLPFIPDLETGLGYYQHLEYTGCGTTRTGSVELSSIMIRNYPWVFSKPVHAERLRELNSTGVELPRFLRQGKNAGESVLVPRWRYDDVHSYCEEAGNGEHEARVLEDIWRECLLKPPEITPFLVDTVPEIQALVNVWDGSLLSHFELSSVGMAIATAVLRHRCGEVFELTRFLQCT